MSSLKQCLKLAKSAIDANDPETALEYVADALDYDKNNFFAYIFQGKSYQLLEQGQKAVQAFRKATAIEPDNLLGWKGFFQVVSTLKDYELFFDVLTKYVRAQVDQQQSIGETLKEVRNYLSKNKYKKDIELYKKYLANIVPGAELYEYIGNSLGSEEENLKQLLDLAIKEEDDRISKLMYKHRLKLPKVLSYEQKAELNAMIWPIYKHSQVDSLFDRFLNLCNDDNLRVKYQEKHLRYKYQLLDVAPRKDGLLEQVKDMIEGLILINTPSIFVWDLYFQLLDPSSFDKLVKERLAYFIDKFQEKGLGMLLFAFVNSEISPFDPADFAAKASNLDQTVAENDNASNEEKELLEEAEDYEAADSTSLTQEQVLALMKQGIKKCPDNILAKRIIINYYIHLREYVECSKVCNDAIRKLADLQRNIGVDLVHAREDVVCSLAVVYTFHEAPKNFSRALELYNKVLETNKSNKRARIGKGLILIEKGDTDTAKETLKEVVAEFPDDIDAALEYGWCEIKLGNYSQGRQLLKQAINAIKGHDLRSNDLRAMARWRMAKSYLLEKDDSSNVNEAYKALIESLKDSKTYAPSYTLLGIIYHEYYQEANKAQKCFYKAFELDAAEVESARYLVQHLADKNEWEIADILCTRVVETEKSRRALNSEKDKSWPYRVLGCSALNKQDDGKAVEWFQTALRMAAMDLECWIGLGEAYYNSGRLEAAQKVFRRALLMDETSWVVMYMLGKAICDTREYDEGIAWLNKALEMKPNEECILNALFQAKLEYTYKLMNSGFFGRVMKTNLEAFALIRQASKVNLKSQSLWIALGASLRVFLKIQDNLHEFPIKEISDIFTPFEKIDGYNDPFLTEVDSIEEINVEKAIMLFEEKRYIESISAFIVLTFKIAIHMLPNQGRYLRSVNYFNLGVAFYDEHNHVGADSSRGASIKCLKKAIQLEPKNSKFWAALGNAYVSLNPQISQHALIKAIALESRDGDIWNNLAVLYLKYGDTELAQSAFARAQSVAPEQAQSWLGNALAAKAMDDKEQASSLFTHAFILSNGRSPLAQLLYALSIINKRIIESNSDPRSVEAAQEFSVANFAIQSFLRFYPNDILGLKIALTISERCKSFELAEKVGRQLCDILEQNYEKSESQAVLEDFVNAKAQLSRICIANEQYEEAIAEALLALDVIGPKSEIEESSVEKLSKVILSCRVTIGLSYYFRNELEKSLEQLRIILSDYSDSKRLITLTAQILNAFGTESTKQAALDQLFTFIDENGSSLIVVLTLGAISLADKLQDYLPAIKDELSALSLEEITQDSFKAVPRLLEEINKLQGSGESYTWQTNAILFPQDYHVWKHINDKMALNVAQLDENKLAAADMSTAFIKNGNFRQIQRGLILCPTNQEGWKKLEHIVDQQ